MVVETIASFRQIARETKRNDLGPSEPTISLSQRVQVPYY